MKRLLSTSTRVLIVVPSMGMGGAERMIVDLMRSLDHSGDYDFLVCCVEDVKWYYQYQPTRPPVCLHHRGSWRDWAALLRTVRALKQVINDFQPHIVHSHLWFADFVTALANWSKKIPHIVHLHDTCEWKSSRRLGFRLRRWMYARVLIRSNVQFVSCSDNVARMHEQSLGMSSGQIVLIPHGIDCSAFCPAAEFEHREFLRLGSVGRFVEMKGHRYLFEAFSQVLKSGRMGIELLIAGDGPLRGKYEKWVEELGIGDYTRVVGAIQNVPEFLRSLDIYVQSSSSSEASPIAVLEAMACGLPIVATSVAGIPEQIEHGVNGLLVPPRDSGSLAEAIHKLCDHPELRQSFGAANAERARKLFSLEAMACRLSDLYRTLAHRLRV